MIHIHLTDATARVIYFDELSSGELSLLTIIFGLYGNDLKEGFLIINEPELHLHPQIQKELAHTLEQISENIQSQMLISTNSSLFINESNITNVYRVYRNHLGESKIISPKINVDYDDATLIHMLKFENLSKIFFVNKIILVE
ncbi:MAG: AAA family ATPase [bacterium]|nr:AAA family ATPase [bacterium]